MTASWNMVDRSSTASIEQAAHRIDLHLKHGSSFAASTCYHGSMNDNSGAQAAKAPVDALTLGAIDPTPLFDVVRWSYGAELLTAAVAHFDLFALLAKQPLDLLELGNALHLAPRAANVLVTALRAMGVLVIRDEGKIAPSDLARQSLVRGAEFHMGDYVGLAAELPGVKNIVERLRTNKPVEYRPEDQGMGFMFGGGRESAMDHESSARRLTLALAGRARIVGPALAQNFPLPRAKKVLDVGGGSGLYAIALLRATPALRAIVWDGSEVLKVAREFARKHNVEDRMEFIAGDMFADPVPMDCDVMLLSNVLHDWDIPQCEMLLRRCAEALATDGRLLIHDVFLDDDLGGPLPVALYSAALFNGTEGRAYSAAEYRQMLASAGLRGGAVVPTLVHCGVMPAIRKQGMSQDP